MLFDLLLLAVGIVLLVGGGDAFVRGASALAKDFGVSPLVIGLTVVAFGTSAPELAVNVLAALSGNGDISFGNIIGSNIANLGLVLGIAALTRPLAVDSVVIFREIPMLLLATAGCVALAGDFVFVRSDGWVMLLLFTVFLYYTVGDVLRPRPDDALAQQALAISDRLSLRLLGRRLLPPLLGLGALILGAQITVAGAVGLAEALNVPRVVIGLSVVAIGTSLPELVTTIVASWRGMNSLAVGNVVGSNIFNLLFIQGLTASIRPIAVPEGGMVDLAVMALLSALLLPLAVSSRNRIVRAEGGLLLLIYLLYLGLRVT